MNEKLIVLLLVILIIESAFALWSNRITLGRNAIIAADGEKAAREQMKDAREEMKRAQEAADLAYTALKRERGKQLAPVLILTADGGVKVLPTGWEKHFEAAWAAPAEKAPEV